MTTSTAVAADWAGSPISTLHHLGGHVQMLPVEQYLDDSCYVVRLEVPGIDPSRDLTVTVEGGMLLVRAERRPVAAEGSQSEFRYGSFARHVTLPLGSDVHDVSAACHNGILTVRVGLQPEHQRDSTMVPVTIEP
jgi:HSP20 family protein